MIRKLVASLLTGVAALVGTTVSAAPPNIVLILADDLGYGDVNTFYPATPNRTPEIDKLAAEGMKLTSFYVNPICSPTRAELLTGRRPVRDGWAPALQPTSTSGIDQITFAERLRRGGLATGIFGKWHVGNVRMEQYNPLNNGFTTSFVQVNGNGIEPIQYMRGHTILTERPTLREVDPRYTREAISFIKKNAAMNKPFFAFLSLSAVHTTLYTDYRTEVEDMDKRVGEIVKALADAEIANNTLLIFMSDNGAVRAVGGSNGPLKGEKNFIYEGGVRVPFIARWPGRIPHKTVSAPAIVADLFPTFLKIAGLTPATRGRIDGEDISPVLFNTGVRKGTEFPLYHQGRMRGFRSGNWKIVLTKDGVATQLYNLSDIGETDNLAKRRPALLQSLAARARVVDANIPREPGVQTKF